MLTGSGEVLVYYIKQWRHHFESGRAGVSAQAKNVWPPLCLKFCLWVSLSSWAPLRYLHGVLSLLCDPFTPVYGPFTSICSPFTLVSPLPSPSREGCGVVCTGYAWRYTGWPKNGSFLYAFTSSNINQFSKLFHSQNQEKTNNNTIIKDPTTPQVSVPDMTYNVFGGTLSRECKNILFTP